MKFQIGMPKDKNENDIFLEGYIKLKEPHRLQTFFYFMLMSIVVFVIFNNIYYLFGYNLKNIFPRLFHDLFYIIFIVIVHEILHSLLFPCNIFSNKIIFGFSFIFGGVFYTYFKGEISRYRYIAVLLFPFVVLSLLPLSILSFLPVHFLLLKIAFLNSLISGGDLVSSLIIIKNSPKNSIMINNGFDTYYKINKNL